MSALGQKQTYAVHKAMSALPPIATAKADSRKPRKRTSRWPFFCYTIMRAPVGAGAINTGATQGRQSPPALRSIASSPAALRAGPRRAQTCGEVTSGPPRAVFPKKHTSQKVPYVTVYCDARHAVHGYAENGLKQDCLRT
jgi:hypothetical protein